MNYWIDSCEDDHPKCSENGMSALPTRVIDVGGDTRDPFLFDPGGKVAPWVALSYCWGNNTTLKTETANLKKRRERIGLEELPTLLRDAVIITRHLGYQYLWIDSLCIIQDSSVDWNIESAKMGISTYLFFFFFHFSKASRNWFF